MQNYYEKNKSIYANYLKKLDTYLAGVTYSIYLRGSANKLVNQFHYKPWDIDMVLFCHEVIDCYIIEKIKEVTFKFNNEITPMGYPYVDFRFLYNPENNSSDSYLLYLLKEDSYLIKGNGCEFINNAKKPSEKELIDLYNKNIEIAINKYQNIIYQSDNNDKYDHKIKNIIKSISRCGCILLLLKDDVFTRDVNSGLKKLQQYFMDDAFLNIQLPISNFDCIHDIHLALLKIAKI
ncbi:hypothetical protein [Providencia sp. PROV120]|uniref:hypothetical protein n=1 Tax=Providencia sp. PROV120 TaxID=2949831 RepID=UPI00234B4597|nr:hypothetical protein [Providencia sp. PROV120]